MEQKIKEILSKYGVKLVSINETRNSYNIRFDRGNGVGHFNTGKYNLGVALSEDKLLEMVSGYFKFGDGLKKSVEEYDKKHKTQTQT